MGRRGGGESEREKEGTRHDTAGEVHLLYVIHLTMARSTGHRHGDGTKTRTKLQICLGTEYGVNVCTASVSVLGASWCGCAWCLPSSVLWSMERKEHGRFPGMENL